MRLDISDFAWPVSEDGYEVVDVPDKPSLGEAEKVSLFLARRAAIHSRRSRTRNVKPFEASRALFGEFARLAHSPEDIVEFANSFGPLGGEFSRSIRVPIGVAHTVFVVGESVEQWYEEIHAMKLVIDLWAHVKKVDRTATQRYLIQQAETELSSPGWPFPIPGPLFASRRLQKWASSLIQSETQALPSEGDERLEERDPLAVAMECIIEVINWRLPPGLNARLGLAKESERSGSRAQLYLAPASLHQAIWLEFALVVLRAREYDECDQCRKWFQVPIRHCGRPRHYCSESCRLKAYRHRQAEARRLQKEGTSAEEIAHQLGSKPEVVKGWIAK